MAKLTALGGLELEPGTFTQPRPLLLLAYLCAEGPQPRRRLAELFWPSGDRMKSLSMALSRLQAGAPGVVRAERYLVRAACESDVGELLRALEQRRWRRAVELYRGAFLGGVAPRGWGREIEGWVFATRASMAGRVQRALMLLAEGARYRGEAREAGSLAERAYTLTGAATPDTATLEWLHELLHAGGSALAATLAAELAEA